MSDAATHLESCCAKGPISFERFMELALYDPIFGYYTTNIATVGGRAADFATSATLSHNLGKAIARWIQAQFDECNIRTVIEVGGGDGSLAREVLKVMGFFLRRKIDYRMVEISPVLQKRQQQAIGRNATWHPTIHEAISGVDEAIVFSNELVDAFPVRWLRWNDRWEEIFVHFSRSSGLREVFQPLENPELAAEIPAFLEIAQQRIEIHDSYYRWTAEWMPKLKQASVLTIDYGGSAEEIYHRRLAGTLRGYFRHQRVEGGEVYQRFGKQDLTADVNFDDVKRRGLELAYLPANYETQHEFLKRFGIDDDSLAGANEAFRVLEQVKRAEIQTAAAV